MSKAKILSSSIWAPWRKHYINRKRDTKKCIFCTAIKNPKKNFVLQNKKFSCSMLNIYPYNNGHILVFPKRHVSELSQLNENEIIEINKLLIETTKILKSVLKPQGYNIGINLGKAAGASLKHLHIHIVPRWKGDTNFMPVVSKIKVISESLESLYNKFKKYDKT